MINMGSKYKVSLYRKITNNKYFKHTQFAGATFGSYYIIKFLISFYVLPITSFEGLFVMSFLLFAYVYLLKSYWVDGDDIKEHWVLATDGNKHKIQHTVESNFAFKDGSYAGIIYAIIGIPFVLILTVFLMATLGWMTILMKSYQERYDNTFDKIVVVYISPIVSIFIIGFTIISTL